MSERPLGLTGTELSAPRKQGWQQQGHGWGIPLAGTHEQGHSPPDAPTGSPTHVLVVVTAQSHWVSLPLNLRATHVSHAEEWWRLGAAERFGKFLIKCFLQAIHMIPPNPFFSIFLSKACTTNSLIEQPALDDVLFQHDLNQGKVLLFTELTPPFHSRVTTATCISRSWCCL